MELVLKYRDHTIDLSVGIERKTQGPVDEEDASLRSYDVISSWYHGYDEIGDILAHHHQKRGSTSTRFVRCECAMQIRPHDCRVGKAQPWNYSVR